MKQTKARILHVDDHQDTRLLIAAMLSEAGYGVMTAGSVKEALALAREIVFDLFLLDVRLPDGSGVELCQQLRRIRGRIPVLYYSAYGSEQDHREAVARCGDAYLLKPVATSELEQAIAGLLAPRLLPPS